MDVTQVKELKPRPLLTSDGGDLRVEGGYSEELAVGPVLMATVVVVAVRR